MPLKTPLLCIITLLLSTTGYSQQQQKEKYQNKANDPSSGGEYDHEFSLDYYDPDFSRSYKLPPYTYPINAACDSALKAIFFSSPMANELPKRIQVTVYSYDFKKNCFLILAVSVHGAYVARCEYYPKAKALLNIADPNNIVPVPYDHQYDVNIDLYKYFWTSEPGVQQVIFSPPLNAGHKP